MISRLVRWCLAVVLLGGASGASARDQKSGVNSSNDPVMSALSRGVDHIDVNPQDPSLQRRDGRYQIVNGDIFDLQFQFTPDFNQTVTVQPDGYITLKEVGDIHVQGETVPEIKQQIETAYLKILAKPVVTVTLKEFNKPYFLALGQVARPGKYDLHGDITVSEAIAMAGGFTTEAKHSQVLLFRRVNDRWSSVTKMDLKHMLNSRNLSEDSVLHPGDMVYIPQNTLSKVKAFIPSPSVGGMVPLY